MGSENQCPSCMGKTMPGKTTFTVDYGIVLVVFRNVSATVCQQCEEAWISNSVASYLGSIVNEAKSGGREFEVINLAAELPRDTASQLSRCSYPSFSATYE